MKAGTLVPTGRGARVWVSMGIAACCAIGLWFAAGHNLTAQEGGTKKADVYVPFSKPKVRMNRMIERLEQGYAVFSGVDYQWVDQEHAAMDFPNLRRTMAKMQEDRNERGQVRLPPIVRVPTEGDQEVRWIIKQTLEAGPMGIIVPHVKTKADALKVVAAARYPQIPGSKYFEPNGVRGHGCGVNCGPLTWGLRMDAYMRLADPWPHNPDGELFVMAMIESDEAVNNINELLDVPGISAWFIGPSDLSTEMTGKPFRAYHWPDNKNPPQVEAAIQKVARACKAKNKVCGMAAQVNGDPKLEEVRTMQLIKDGFKVILQAPLPRQGCTKKAPEC